MKKVNIGLDIGIASVGWSIFDINNKKILKSGSRLFNEANAGTNKSSTTADRRMQRGRRRNLRRKILRKRDLLVLFKKYNFIKNEIDFYNLDFNHNFLELRTKALKEKITIDQLMVILFNYIKKRGSFNFKDDLLERKNIKMDNLSLDQINVQENILPLEIQQKNYLDHGKYRGLKTEDSLIAHEWYKNELIKILDIQISNNLISESFKEDYLNLFDRKRLYFEGPGFTTSSRIEKSKYGWKDEEEFYSRLSGYDTYDSSEKRAPKHSMTSYLFNILNDLNNLKIEKFNDGLSYEQKYKIIDSVINHDGNKNKNITLKHIAKLIDVEESSIKGYRIDKDSKPNFTKFEFINNLRTVLINSKLDYSFINLNNVKLLDEIANILTTFQTADSRKAKLLSINSFDLNEDQAEAISLISLSGTHSLSYKTMNIAIEEMWYENKNHMQIFSEKNIKPDYNIKINRRFNSMPLLKRKISDMYISPVVKRSLIESIKIIKEIEKMDEYEIKDIVIELARESNSEDLRKHITEIQKKNEKENNEIINKHNISTVRKDFKTKLKLALFNEQDGKCAYSNKEILLDRLLNDPNYCEIDHIIPFSVSLDDSRANKVLVLWSENQQKGKKTPYKYFREINRDWLTFKTLAYNHYIKNKNFGKYGHKKYENLVFEDDIDNDEVKQSFINRNLNDTRYATLEVKNYLTYFKKELNKSYSIKTINGSFTHYIRNNYLHLPKKDRDDFKHHAIDATVCAIAPLIDIIEGKTINSLSNEELSQDQIIKKEELNNLIKDILTFDYKITKKVEKKSNTMLFNDTIYTCKNINNQLYKVEKIDLLTLDNAKLKTLKSLFTTDMHKLSIYESDKKTYEYLKKVFDAYVNDVDIDNKPVKNPFYHFVYELKEKLVKQSNETNPPNIRYLKYIGKKVEKYTSITHKFKNVKRNKEIVMTGSNTLGWDLFYSEKYNLYKILPITHEVARFKTNDYSSDVEYKIKDYEIMKEKLNIDNTYIKKYTLNKNNELIFNYDNNLFHLIVIGYARNTERLEFKYLDKKTSSEKRITYAVKKMKNIKLITTNSTRTKIKVID
ncbi:type II CRISPR RNA-guided endonuclease Cas9 [Spiroplasma turonicum]|uniref:CRISPR-associated endonuclease Cas9 n=1 Tax=Spiroplasma turonicum TaxID=216946 RepID=A0A0K1P6G0_9MOLU|nr:type II CRISPR RNA-guided endonuclease Cas9 [Spiroplasma turonicum]AKU79870.1 CRISPR-associated protein [Spiroplasma turonicum]ALX70886.1 CRISPR-associated protein Cas9 [Spiroplasma turonicum]